ncbi:hypothetical protein B566_EDAN008110 [Ephemera danica]|nr:hypothetical protein B566_EDAN008110 [Ephemera danica]
MLSISDMKCLLVVSCILAAATASPGVVVSPYHAAGVAIAHAPAAVSSQYHAQDELGQYSYGYAGGPSAKHEVKTFDGVTRGGYSYVDAHGLVQSVNYVADPVNGFRVAATNLPVAPPADPLFAIAQGAPVQVGDSHEVAVAKSAHFAAQAEAIARLGRKKRGVIAAPHGLITSYAAPSAFGYSVNAVAPLVHAAAPIAYAAAPAHVVAANKYHAQDALGQYSYGYNDGLSAKHESRTADGVTHGGYSYVDSHGLLQSVKYTADPVHGFRVAATNLP